MVDAALFLWSKCKPHFQRVMSSSLENCKQLLNDVFSNRVRWCFVTAVCASESSPFFVQLMFVMTLHFLFPKLPWSVFENSNTQLHKISECLCLYLWWLQSLWCWVYYSGPLTFGRSSWVMVINETNDVKEVKNVIPFWIVRRFTASEG